MKVDRAKKGQKNFPFACRKGKCASILHLQIFQSKVVFDPRTPPPVRPSFLLWSWGPWTPRFPRKQSE